MRILAVDDDAHSLWQLKRVLEEQRYAVKIASDGILALDILFGEAFDLIILGIMMPRADGFSFLRDIRSMSVDVPVLMLSAKGDIDVYGGLVRVVLGKTVAGLALVIENSGSGPHEEEAGKVFDSFYQD